jgi:ABC-type transport system involved in multi-copper enzyme maturation permease subunit
MYREHRQKCIASEAKRIAMRSLEDYLDWASAASGRRTRGSFEMTAAAASANRVRPILRPVPWRRMAWVTWRQHRSLLTDAAITFGAVAIYLTVVGFQIHTAYTAVEVCRPIASSACRQVLNNFFGAYQPGVGIPEGVLQPLPALIGAFAGAPILAREFETGTFRFAWTQGIGRTRWVTAKLVPLAVILTGVAVLVSLLFSWYYQPLIEAGDNNGQLFPTVFDLSGVALAGWTLFAFALGVFAGTIIRKVVPAMFVTLAAWAGLAALAGTFLRAHYIAPLVSKSLTEPHPAWVLSQNWVTNGQPATLDAINRALAAIEWRDACRKFTLHLKKHYADVPVWEHDPYVGEPVWPLVKVSGRELKVRDHLYVGITEEQADRWKQVR